MSSPSSHTYETVYVFVPHATDDAVTTVNNKIDSVVSKFHGKVKVRDDWGVKHLAYPIQEHKNARYFVINYTGDSGVVEEIERHFKIFGDVIRYLTVAIEEDYNYDKVKKQIVASEEEAKKARELRAEKRAGGRKFREY